MQSYDIGRVAGKGLIHDGLSNDLLIKNSNLDYDTKLVSFEDTDEMIELTDQIDNFSDNVISYDPFYIANGSLLIFTEYVIGGIVANNSIIFS